MAGAAHEDAYITLRPLHRHDLEGWLAAELPDPDHPDQRWLVEFRNNQGWDGAVPEAAVLTHRLEAYISYLVPPGVDPRRDYLRAGDAITRGPLDDPHYRFEVVSINHADQTCVLRFSYRRTRNPFDWLVAPVSGQVLGNIAADGGGLFIRPGGGIVPIGPMDPMLPILQNIAAIRATDQIQDTAAREAAQRSALKEIIKIAQSSMDRLQVTKTPAQGKSPPIPPPK
jgi:hypothetical protein